MKITDQLQQMVARLFGGKMIERYAFGDIVLPMPPLELSGQVTLLDYGDQYVMVYGTLAAAPEWYNNGLYFPVDEMPTFYGIDYGTTSWKKLTLNAGEDIGSQVKWLGLPIGYIFVWANENIFYIDESSYDIGNEIKYIGTEVQVEQIYTPCYWHEFSTKEDINATTITLIEDFQSAGAWRCSFQGRVARPSKFTWYKDNYFFSSQEGGNFSECQPQLDEKGTFSYRCRVDLENGAPVYSDYLTVIVKAQDDGVNKDIPFFSINLPHLEKVSYNLNEQSAPLQVLASLYEGGTLLYQWYVVKNGRYEIVKESSSNSFIPPTDVPGSYIYGCVAKNIKNNEIVGTARSNEIIVMIVNNDWQPSQYDENEFKYGLAIGMRMTITKAHTHRTEQNTVDLQTNSPQSSEYGENFLKGLEVGKRLVRLRTLKKNQPSVVLEVKKVVSDTYANSTTYTDEEFVLLDIYPKTYGTVSITYGNVTKIITDQSGATNPNAHQVFFGKFHGVADEIDTPASGTLLINGDYNYFQVGTYVPQKVSTTQYCDCITSITSFGGIKKIASNMFYNCTNLSDVVLPEGIETIGYSAFYGCTGLKKIVVPSTVFSIGSSAFSNCTNLQEAAIQKGVTTIPYGVFSGCSSLTKVDIPEGVTSISNAAFKQCISLAKLTIPSTITSIDGNPFSGVPSIEAIEFLPENPAYYITNNCIIERETRRLVSGFPDTIIPEEVLIIGKYAFSYCDGLTTITIPNSINKIESYAFQYCPNLESLVLPNSISEIETSVFQYSEKLITVKLPDNLSSISSSLFYSCSGLENIVLPNTLESIGASAFGSCSKLKKISIPGSVLSIGEEAFYNAGLTELILNEGIEVIEEDAFYSNEIVNLILPNSLVTIGDGAFSYCSNLISVNLPKNLKDVGTYVFGYCDKLTQITIEDGVTIIPRYFFYNCEGLTTITIPASVLTIDSSAFQACFNLSVINLTEGIERINSTAFYKANISNITFPSSLIFIGSSAFGDCPNLSKATFRETSNWYVKKSGEDTTTALSVTSPSINAENLKSTYKSYDWYRE